MKQIADKNGTVLQGLFREPNGGIVVNNIQAYERSLAEKAKIENMQNQIDSLNTTVKELADLIRNMVK